MTRVRQRRFFERMHTLCFDKNWYNNYPYCRLDVHLFHSSHHAARGSTMLLSNANNEFSAILTGMQRQCRYHSLLFNPRAVDGPLQR